MTIILYCISLFFLTLGGSSVTLLDNKVVCIFDKSIYKVYFYSPDINELHLLKTITSYKVALFDQDEFNNITKFCVHENKRDDECFSKDISEVKSEIIHGVLRGGIWHYDTTQTQKS